MTPLEKDFEKFFNSLTKQQFSSEELEYICKPLENYNRYEKIKKWLKILLSFGFFYLLVIWCDSLSWLLSAAGRLFLIELLPYWNWPDLYNAKCLIHKHAEVNENDVVVNKLGRFETEEENCLLCETIDYIPTLTNTSFTYMESMYLERSYVVIVKDSHEATSPDDIFGLIFNKSFDFLKSNPCDVSTNLMLNKMFGVEMALRKALKLNHSSDKWFLQIRNCQFKAVKSSRNFIKRPYYYPAHLEPFYSSWLIMSHNYNHKYYRQTIVLHGLIIVQQLWGSMNFSLSAKEPCLNCPDIKVNLKEGESLIFSTDLWTLNYEFLNDHIDNIATIVEIEWSV